MSLTLSKRIEGLKKSTPQYQTSVAVSNDLWHDVLSKHIYEFFNKIEKARSRARPLCTLIVK